MVQTGNFMSIRTQLEALRAQLPREVALVAVSKMHPAAALEEAYEAGQRLFGESRPQEMATKQAALPNDIAWHMIGHLQTNKVRSIIPFVSLIHSVDSQRILDVIDREAARAGRIVEILLEIHIAQEATKAGWEEVELLDYLHRGIFMELRNVRFRGLMGIASLTSNQSVVETEFCRLRLLFERLRGDFFTPAFDTLSMGMTADWQIAVACGSNMIRVGSRIFGERG